MAIRLKAHVYCKVPAPNNMQYTGCPTYIFTSIDNKWNLTLWKKISFWVYRHYSPRTTPIQSICTYIYIGNLYVGHHVLGRGRGGGSSTSRVGMGWGMSRGGRGDRGWWIRLDQHLIPYRNPPGIRTESAVNPPPINLSGFFLLFSGFDSVAESSINSVPSNGWRPLQDLIP